MAKGSGGQALPFPPEWPGSGLAFCPLTAKGLQIQ